jgi:SynChlorMet cassette radical SAM/SPASM protein ScmE
VRVTIHRHNVDDLEEIARLLIEELGLPGFSTNSAGEMGLCRRNRDDVSLTVAERSRAMETLVRLNGRHGGRISAAAGPQAEARMWSEMLEARRDGKRIAGRGTLSACGCTSSKIAVRADGVIVPCCMLSQIALGRINRDDLQKIWLEHPAMQQMRSRRTIALTAFEFCRGCEFIDLCTGNCPGLAYTLTGQVDHPSPDACLRRFLEAGGRVPGRALPDRSPHTSP